MAYATVVDRVILAVWRIVVACWLRSTKLGILYQPPRSTQPGHPSVGRHNEYQPEGGDALQLGSKGRLGSCMGGS